MRTKFIPVLAVAMLLSACGTSNSVSVKAPKFAKLGKEVTAEEFAEDAMAKLNALDLNKEEPLGSKVINYKEGNEEGQKITNDGLVKLDKVEKDVTNGKYEYDSKNLVAKVSSDIKTSMVANMPGGHQETFEQQQAEGYYQEVIKDDKHYFGMVFPSENQVNIMQELNEMLTLEYMADMMMRSVCGYAGGINQAMDFIENQIPSLTDEDKEDFKFYQNGDTFTVKFNAVTEETNKDDGDNDVYVEKTEYVQTLQYTVKGNNVKFAFAYEEYYKTTFVQDYYDYYNQYVAGDVEDYYSKQYGECEIKESNVSLKAASYDGYSFVSMS